MSRDGVVRSSKRIIRVTPTVDSGTAYAAGDVLFNPTEIPRAVIEKGGCSKLVAMYVVNQNTTDVDIDFIFSENSAVFGTINATADISDSDLEAANVTGFLSLDAGESSTSQIDNAEIKRVGVVDAGGSSTLLTSPILLQAASNSTSVYVVGILTGTNTPTYAADDIDLVLHIED
jgi:hypothetical protein